MKLSVILILTCIFHATASTYAQEQRIHVDIEKGTFHDLVSQIEKQSEFRFFYKSEEISHMSEITLKVNNKLINDILNEIARKNNLRYTISGKHIIITRKEESKQQGRVLKGTVKDSTGEPVIGANIIESGTTNGTVTDLDGAFELTVTSENTLTVSYIGYHTQVIPMNGKSNFIIILIEDFKTLDEVIVVGYGTVKKSDLTGSVSSITSDQFNKGANVSVGQLLSGKSTGMQITQASAEPGGGMRVRIRGASSVNAGNEPLYVIDGLPIDNSTPISSSGLYAPDNQTPRSPLNSINPADIESIEVLKDASAAAIYGSRGANGVVLITTKRGKNERLKVDYNYYYATQKASKKLDILDTNQYIRVINELEEAEGRAPRYTDADIAAIGKGTDWQDEVLRRGHIENHNLSFSGGSDKSNYFVSLNYYDQSGILLSSNLKRYTAKVNFEHAATDKFKFGVNFNTSWVKDRFTPNGISINANAGVTATALSMPPVYPLFDDDGNLFQTNNIDLDNPVALARGIDSREETERTFGTFFAEYAIIPDLKLKVNLGTDRRSNRKDVYNSTLTKQGKAQGGAASVFNSKNTNYLAEVTLSYFKEWKEHTINAVAGYTYENFEYSYMMGNIINMPDDDLKTNNLGLGDTENDNLGSSRTSNKLASYIGRVNYSYRNKYLLTLSLRADGSSRFGENNKFAYFPSTAVAWHAGREQFISDMDIFHTLKVRGSWGMTGNQEIGNYNSISTYSSGGTATLGGVTISGIIPARIANPDLKWETTTQVNIGLDIDFLQGRIKTSWDYFNKKTTDILLQLPVSPSSGFESALQNIGAMRNTGFEFQIDTRNIIAKNFTWSTSFNLSTLRNKVLDTGPLPEILAGDVGFTTDFCIIRKGAPLNAYYGYEVIGIFQEGDDIANSAQPDAKPGDPIFKNQNPETDNVINADDRVIIGDPFPDFTFGLTNMFTFKDFDFSFFIQGEIGADILNQNLLETLYPIETVRNRYAEPMLNRWTAGNTNTKWPSGINPTSYGGGRVNTLTIENASFVRLKSIEVGYNYYPKGFIARCIRSARIYFSAQNLFVWTNYMGYDPEVNSVGTSNIKYDYNSYPSARTYQAGVNITF